MGVVPPFHKVLKSYRGGFSLKVIKWNEKGMYCLKSTDIGIYFSAFKIFEELYFCFVFISPSGLNKYYSNA